MKTVTIKYRKHKFIKGIPLPLPTLQKVVKDVLLPEKIEELNAETFMFIADKILMNSVTDQALILSLKLILELEDADFYNLDPAQVNALCKHIDWLKKPVQKIEETIIKYVCLKNGLRVEGPKNSLSDLTMEEMAYCESYYLAFFESINWESANKLAACLYRPSRATISFNDMLIEEYAAMWNDMPQGLVMAIVVQYHYQMKTLEHDFPNIFPKSDEVKSRTKNLMWVDLIYSLPTENYGTIKERKNTRVSDFLGEAEYRILNPVQKK
jgi:hypothetical protein